MSPKFSLALLLLCLVLLGLSNAQPQWRPQQQLQQRPQQQPGRGYRQHGRVIGRTSGGLPPGDGFGAGGGVPPLDGGVDCGQNTLALNRRDRFSSGK